MRLFKKRNLRIDNPQALRYDPPSFFLYGGLMLSIVFLFETFSVVKQS